MPYCFVITIIINDSSTVLEISTYLQKRYEVLSSLNYCSITICESKNITQALPLCAELIFLSKHLYKPCKYYLSWANIWSKSWCHHFVKVVLVTIDTVDILLVQTSNKHFTKLLEVLINISNKATLNYNVYTYICPTMLVIFKNSTNKIWHCFQKYLSPNKS